MRKVLLNLAVSLDGFIEGPKGEFDWCFVDQDYGMQKFLERIDALFIGRKSYEVLIAYDPNPYPDKTKFLFTNTLNISDQTTQILKGDIVKAVQEIRKAPGKDIWLFGGAELISSFINNNLLDELHLSVHPLILGSGKPLFSNIKERTNFNLINTKTYSTGLVQLIYEIKR